MSVISTSARFSASAAATPAKPPPTITTRFLFPDLSADNSASCENDLVRTVVMEAPVVEGRATRLTAIPQRPQPILNAAAVHGTAVPDQTEEYALGQVNDGNAV